VILQKTRKIHLADALSSATRSITTAEDQALLLDRARLGAVRGKRVALVDDVISTGSSIVASLNLLREAEADVVAIGALLAEGTGWREKLGADADLVFTLGTIPIFDATAEGWTPRW
jgi:adenine/guanine phosphoribosyltransferase-like PRPP-binding protein